MSEFDVGEVKLPLGIIPKKIHDEQRLVALNNAILRYIDTYPFIVIPAEWIEERNDLVERGVGVL